MEDATILVQGQAAHGESGVIRRFSPVRIEQLLLARLFDLVAGQVMADLDEGEPASTATEFQTETTPLVRKEAA